MWNRVDKEKPPVGKTVGVYDAFHVGLSEGEYDGEEFDVEDDGGRGTFVTHWTEHTPPSGSPDPDEVHSVCRSHF